MATNTVRKNAAVALLDQQLRDAASGHERVKIQSLYVWPSDVVWRRDWSAISTFIVYGPSPKRPNEAGIYLCWSRQMRFPELSARPWILLGAGGDSPLTLAEGSFFVSDLAPDLPAWMHFAPDRPVEAVLQPYVDVLLHKALPFIEDLVRAADQSR